MQSLSHATKQVSWCVQFRQLLRIVLQMRLMLDSTTTNLKKLMLLAHGLAPIRNTGTL
jgi:hypothetical protein